MSLRANDKTICVLHVADNIIRTSWASKFLTITDLAISVLFVDRSRLETKADERDQFWSCQLYRLFFDSQGVYF